MVVLSTVALSLPLTSAPVVGGAALLAALAVVAVPWTWDRWRSATAARLSRSALVLLATASLVVTGLLFVNAQGGFFPTVSSLLTGRGGTVTVGKDGVVQQVTEPTAAPVDLAVAAQRRARGHGAVVQVTITGARSGVTRAGAVYLPAAYFAADHHQARFPVVELLSGSPGSPAQSLHELRLAPTLDQLILTGVMAPTVVVLPDTNGSPLRDRECVDAAHGVADDTYLTSDVQDWVAARFRVQEPGRGWALLGPSTGGYCSVNLALRHPDRYGAAASLSGYYHALTDITTGRLFDGPRLRDENDPSWLVTHRPVPDVALWLSAGTGERPELADLRSFAALLPASTDLTTLVVPGAGHAFPSWRAVLPQAMGWASAHLPAPTAQAAALPGQQLTRSGGPS